MRRDSFVFALFLCCLAPVRTLAAQAVDTAGAGKVIDEATNRSQVMENLQHLSDLIGPRLSGSAAMRRANDWTADRFRSYGLTAALEPYTFGVTWERGPLSFHLVAPFTREITAHSWAWTTGTSGKTLTGRVVQVDLSTPDSLAANKGKVRGAWVLPRTSYPVWNPDGPEMTADDSARLAETLRLRGLAAADTSAAAVRARRQFAIDLPYVLKAAGALGTLVDGSKEHALMTMSGSPNRISPLPTSSSHTRITPCSNGRSRRVRSPGSKVGWTTGSAERRRSSGTRSRSCGETSVQARW
jgi:hypothetical protein